MSKKLALSATIWFILLSTTTFAQSQVSFKDIKGHWAENVIKKYTSREIIRGINDDSFKPERKMTRAEFFVMLHRGIGVQIRYIVAPDITKIYKDAKNEDWYANEAYDLHTMGIIDDKDFLRANESITREEMAHYAVNAYVNRLKDRPVATDNLKNKFKDFEKINQKFLYDAKLAYDVNIISGRVDETFDPQGISTRAEGLVVIDKFLKATKTSNIELLEVIPSYIKDVNGLIIKISIKNNSQEDIKISYTSGQKYDFELLDENKNSIYRWVNDKLFMQQMQEVTIKKGETLELSDTLQYKGNESIIERAKYLVGYAVGTVDGQKFGESGYIIEIK